MSVGALLLALFGVGALALLIAWLAPRRKGAAVSDAAQLHATEALSVEIPLPDPGTWGEREAQEFAMLPESARCDLIFSVESARDERSEALLTYALGDPSDAVATAAGHALIARGQRGRVELYLRDNRDERTHAMGVTLQALFPDLAVPVPPSRVSVADIDDVSLYENSSAHPRSARPLLVLALDAATLRENARIIERADSGGMLRHIIALRRLFPDDAVRPSPALAVALRDARVVMNVPIARLSMTLHRARSVVSSKDIEDGESRLSLRSLLDALLATPSASELPHERSGRLLVGYVDLDALAKARVRLDLEPIGAALPWLANALLLPTTVLDEKGEHDILSDYRARASESFSTLCELPVEEFHRVLATHTDRELDALLDSALAKLSALDAVEVPTSSGENTES